MRVYCQQPPGFVDPALPDHVCLLQKSFYGLKQAPRAWYQRFATYIKQIGFVALVSNTSLFVYKDGAHIAYLLLYVDDIMLTASSTSLLHDIIGRLHTEFAMTDLGALHHFLGISITRSSDGLFLSQRQYALDLLQRAGMSVTLRRRQWTPRQNSQLHQLLIPLSTGVWLEPYSTSLLLILILHMLFNKSVYLCMILASLIWRL
jgi:hypothetical protein